MPDWFMNLVYITLSIAMIAFIGCVVAVIVAIVSAAIKEWLKERKAGKRE